MFSPEITQTQPMSVAYVVVHGPYAQIPQYLAVLYGWIARHGLAPAGMPGTAYLSDPSEGPPEQAVFEVWAPVSGDPERVEAVDGDVGVKALEPMLVATATHTGPYESVGETYGRLAQWLVEQGHVISGPPMEFYLTDPATTPPEEYLTEIRLPLATA